MELNEVVGVLIQGVELAQKKGVLSFDDAYAAKISIDALREGKSIKDSIHNLIQIVNLAQYKGGVYSLKDAYYLYLAVTEVEKIKFEDEDKKGE